MPKQTTTKIKPETKPVYKMEEVLEWEPYFFKSYFDFIGLFYIGENSKFNLTRAGVEQAIRLAQTNYSFQDFLLKIDAPWKPEDKLNRRFQMRLIAIINIVKRSVISKPEILPKEVIKENYEKKYCEWLKEIYYNDGTSRSAKTSIQIATEQFNAVNPVVPESANGVLAEAMGRVADIYNKIAISVTDKEIKGMDVKDRISALQKLSYIHNTTKKFKPNMNFIKINTTQASAEKLESALLSFNDDEETEQ